LPARRRRVGLRGGVAPAGDGGADLDHPAGGPGQGVLLGEAGRCVLAVARRGGRCGGGAQRGGGGDSGGGEDLAALHDVSYDSVGERGLALSTVMRRWAWSHVGEGVLTAATPC